MYHSLKKREIDVMKIGTEGWEEIEIYIGDKDELSHSAAQSLSCSTEAGSDRRFASRRHELIGKSASLYPAVVSS